MLTMKLFLAKLDPRILLVWTFIDPIILILVIYEQLIVGFVIVGLEFCQKLVFNR